MRIGLLECDHVAHKFRPIAGDYSDMFGSLFAAHAPGIELVHYDAINGQLPSKPDDCDGYVCTGSRHSAYDDLEWIDSLSAFVHAVYAADVPFVGVCFGHQLLAHALGGRVAKAASGWGAGVKRIDVSGSEPWMTPPVPHLDLHFLHQDQVQELPAGGRLLGSAAHCPIAMFRVGESMFGIQAHPEFTPAYTDALLADRVARIGEDEVAAARAGLSQPTDEATVVRWCRAILVTPGCSSGGTGRPDQ